MKSLTEKLKILRGLDENPAFRAFARLDGGRNEEFLYTLYESRAEKNFTEFICDLILYDDNAFARACAKNEKPYDYLFKAYSDDISEIWKKLDELEAENYFRKGTFFAPFSADPEKTAAALAEFYRKNGYGIFAKYKAFTYADGKISPIKRVSEITLNDLKDYGEEKAAICNNVKFFLDGLSCSDMLLYGDKGTGKSSTVQAVLNAYAERGLRMVELSDESLTRLPALFALLEGNPLKFIVFIDDLSLSEDDERLSALKGALEGSLSAGGDNVMIVATSNRRHIVKESFRDRENSVHPADVSNEQLSLADRFALTVYFSTTDKAGYLSIVRQLAADMKIRMDEEKLCALAERWAVVKGGRSPRRAAQFVEFVYSCEKSGTEIDFAM